MAGYESLEQLISSSGGVDAYYVAVDLGGTNSRVAIAIKRTNQTKVDELLEVAKYEASSAQEFLLGLNQVSENVLKIFGGRSSSGGCIAAAGRILESGLKVDVTNYRGGPVGQEISVTQLPAGLFPVGNTLFINDLESTCYGIYSLSLDDKLSSFFKPLWGASEVSLSPQSYLVLAMGTGLGGAVLHYSRSLKLHEVVPCEFGHTLMPPATGAHTPEGEKEQRMMNYLSQKLYSSQYSLEVEDICSGRGLSYAYEWLQSENPNKQSELITPKEIAERGSTVGADGNVACKLAEEALSIHYKWLFRCAQNICIGCQTRGVFLAGDNQVYNERFVDRKLNDLKTVFLHHPKRSWIENTPVFAQTVSFNINLVGAMFIAKQTKP